MSTISTGTRAPVSPLQDGQDTDLVPLFMLRYDSPNTRRAYSNDLAQFFQSETVTLRMARSVTFVEVNTHLAHLVDCGASPRTMQRRTAALRTFFSWLMALKLIDHNPADRQLVRRLKKTEASQEALTVLSREEAAQLLQAIPTDSKAYVRDRTLIEVMIHCVLRRSEASAMDFEHIRSSGNYKILDLPSTKGGTNQFVKIPNDIFDKLQVYKNYYMLDSGPVWRSLSNNSYGKRLSSRSIYSIVSKAAQRAGIELTVGAHTLRHTGCTLAIEGGASVQQVQSHARHKNIETTMTYVHQRDLLRNNASDFITLGD